MKNSKKNKKLKYEMYLENLEKNDVLLCPLCNRIIPEEQESKHHLIPKSKGGEKEDIVIIHIACHRQIHMVFTNNELDDYYYTVERIKEHSEMEKFINWISKKDPSFLPQFTPSKLKSK